MRDTCESPGEAHGPSSLGAFIRGIDDALIAPAFLRIHEELGAADDGFGEVVEHAREGVPVVKLFDLYRLV